MKEIFMNLDLFVDDPNFYLRAYELNVKRSTQSSSSIRTIFENDAQYALDFLDSELQDSSRIRNIIKTRAIAKALFLDNGLLDEDFLKSTVDFLKKERFLLGPKSIHDAPMEEHLFSMILFLQKDKDARLLLKTISRPISHPYADQLIRDTLLLGVQHVVTDADAKRAVVAALLCYFRQNVGSCFATAPAIIIHNEQPLRFLIDCRELLGTGRLKRTFGGVEYSVPLSPSFGAATLKKPIYIGNKGPELLRVEGLLLSLECMPIKMPVNELISAGLPALKGGFTTMEIIIKTLLLLNYNITEEDIPSVEEKPRDLLQQKLLAETQGSFPKKRTKGQDVRTFQEHFSRAKVVYKASIDNPILRTWEFTLASFSESQADFCKWNLYSSLGMGTHEPHGIGECIYRFLSKKLEEYNEEANEFQRKYEQVFLEVKALESQAKRASSESQMQYIKIEYSARMNELNEYLNKRDSCIEKTRNINQFFQYLLKTYEAKFPEYFQEIYDADMHVEVSSFYDDSPAGFRLLYKHGRTHPSAWSMIYTPDDFVNYLVQFFIMTENEISHSDEIDDLEKEYEELVGEITRHIKTPEFLESAFYRVSKAHQVSAQKNPLENLDKISKKPWAYTSGGSMSTLISCLYSREDPPTESARWVESEDELLVFYADVMKEMTQSLVKPYIDNSKRSMLSFSPTHAFIFKPGMEPFIQAWMESGYTYTWVRDHLVLPRKAFVQKIFITSNMIDNLGQTLCKDLPEEISILLKRTMRGLPSNISPTDFRALFVQQLSQETWVRRLGKVPLSLEDIDSALYNQLPFSTIDNLADKVIQILKHVLGEHGLSQSDISALSEFLASHTSNYSVISSNVLREITEAFLLFIKGCVAFPRDYHAEIIVAMQSLGYLMPRPIMFADSNWVNTRFGFVVNPGTGELELWTLDYTGAIGRPLTSWKKWLRGFEKKPWGVYIRPYEYGQDV